MLSWWSQIRLNIFWLYICSWTEGKYLFYVRTEAHLPLELPDHYSQRGKLGQGNNCIPVLNIMAMFIFSIVGNLFTALWLVTLGRRQARAIVMLSGFFSCPLYFFQYSIIFLPSVSFVLCHSCCSHAIVFGKTLVHEFQISFVPAEWYLIFLRGEIVHAKLHLSKLIKLNNIFFIEYMKCIQY